MATVSSRTQRSRETTTVNKDMKKLFQAQLKLMGIPIHRVGNIITKSSSPEISPDVLLQSITEFLHDTVSSYLGILFKMLSGMLRLSWLIKTTEPRCDLSCGTHQFDMSESAREKRS